MPQNTDYADCLHTGLHQFDKVPRVPDSSFGDAQMAAANPVTTQKLKHQYLPVYAQPNGTAAVTERKVNHVARATGEVAAIEAGIVTAGSGGGMSVTVDLKKNNVSVLTGVITINSTHVAYQRVAGSISSAAYVAGDVFELVITATAGGGTLPQGLFVDVQFRNEAG